MLNLVCLMGRLTADPELKHTPNGVAVVTVTIAVERSFTKQGEEKKTDFIDIVAWRNTAEFISKFFSKGRMLVVQGRIETRTYEDKEGKKRKAFEIVADQCFFGDSKSQQQGGNGGYTQQYQPDVPAPAQAPSFAQGDDESFAVVTDNEDLPF